MGRAACLALMFIGLLAFSNAIRHPFVQDDVVFILKNPHITELNHWPEAFSAPTVSDDVNPYYRPVLEIIYRLEYHFFGVHAWAYHLVNVVLHLINGLLLFGLLQKLGLAWHVAWVVALLFLIHPVQTEAVACIAGISNLCMALGVLLALHAYLKKWYAISMACMVMACLSKEQGILFVPLVMLIDYSRGDKNFRSWIFFGAGACALLWLRQLVTGASLLHSIMASPGELYLRLAAIPRDLEMYLRLIVCPYDLHYYRSTDILKSNTLAWALALLSLVGIGLIYRHSRARPMLVLGLGWFLAALLPVLNIAPVINEYALILTSEHFLYLPIVGILIIVASAADHYVKHFRKLLLGMVVGICLLLTWHQNTFWSNEMVLFERMLKFEPDFGRGHLLLAKAYYFNGRPQDADGHFKKAFGIMAGYAHETSSVAAKKFYLSIEKEILFDWAQNDSAMGRWAGALDKYQQAARIDAKDASLYNNMAFVYLHMGDKNSAQASLEQTLRIDPAFVQARRNLQQLDQP